MKPTSPTQEWLVEHDPLSVVILHDAVIDAVGYDASDPYVETYWLPIVGPSALWALRRLTGWLAIQPSVTVPIAALGAELGLGHQVARSSSAVRTLARLVGFDLAAITPDDTLGVRLVLPPLPRRLSLRLPAHMLPAHDRALQERRPTNGEVVRGAA